MFLCCDFVMFLLLVCLVPNFSYISRLSIRFSLSDFYLASFYLIMFCIWSLLQYLHFLYSFISNPAHLGGVLDTTSYHQFCQRLSACRRFFPDTPVSSTNKTDRHDKTEISLKVALNTINLPLYLFAYQCVHDDVIVIILCIHTQSYQDTYNWKYVVTISSDNVFISVDPTYCPLFIILKQYTML